MLALAEQRLNNAPEEELRVAAAEQSKITALRLQRILEP
jgi:2-oxo-4-hydroxy-4-carboxy-5-ureidoimidazoline decarboxylase